jgi:DUF4097 and DUF4098 domain-containing protein YvlB
MKKLVMIAIVLLIVGIAGTVVLGGSVLSIGPKVEIDEQKTFDANEINRIDVKTDIGDVNIMESESNKIEVHIYGEVSKNQKDRYQIEIEQNGDTVIVTSKVKKKLFSLPFVSFNGGKRAIDIAIPKGMINQLEVDSDVGDINMEQVSVKELDISTDVGKIKADYLEVVKAAIETNVGDTDIKNATGKFDIESDTGKVKLYMETITEDINIESNVGEVVVHVGDSRDTVALDLDTSVGDIDVNGTYMMGKNENGPTVTVKTDVGDIVIEK